MTTLTITPDIAKKKLKLAGTVASGEKVAVTIAGFGIVATENLRLRVMAGDIPVGYFPLENEDAWTVSGADLTCTLNLATWQAERHCKFGAEVCFILEDTGTPQLYGVGDFSLRPWIKLSGVDVPKNLDNYKVRMDALLAEINRVEGVANGKYTKPETGIPKTDLAPSVRTSLDKADAVTLKVSKSAFDALLGLSLPDGATQKDTRQIVQKILTALQNAATCIALMFALPVFGIDGTTAWEDVPPDRTVKSVVEQFSPPADFSTNNQELVETIQAKAAIPDLTAYLRNDKANNETQTFGGYLSGFGFHADTGYNDNGWNQYTAHNGTSLAQSLPSYIFSNPWGFLKQGEAMPSTGGVFQVSTMHFAPRLSIGPWNNSIKPYDISGGSGAAFVFGDNVQAKRSNTMTLGVGALNTNEWSFLWNGDANRMYFPTLPSMSNPYSTRYNGGFHVNPSVREGMENPLENFWIGDKNLNDWITTLSPAPGDYANVSNKAASAVSATSNTITASGVQTDYIAQQQGQSVVGGPRIRWSRDSEQNMTSYAYGGIAVRRNNVNEDYLFDDALQNGIVRRKDIPTTAAEVGAYSATDGQSLANIVNAWEGYWSGTNVIFEVTNYYGNTSGELPRLRVKEFREGEWRTVWDEANKFEQSESNIIAHVAASNRVCREACAADLAAGLADRAPRAWGTMTDKGSTNVVGNSVWMTAPETYFAGGTEYQRVAVGSGAICVLTDNGAGAYTAGEAGTFRFQDEGGTNFFGFAKSDSYTIGCKTDGITVEGTLVTLRYDVIMGGTDVPIVYWRLALNSGEWVQLNNADGTACAGAPYTVTWYTSGGSYYAAINCGNNASGFFKAETSVAGEVVFETNMKVRLGGGIECENTQTGVMGVIRPSYNGSSVNWTWSAR